MKTFTSRVSPLSAGRILACLALMATVSAVQAQFGGRFTPQHYHGWDTGAQGSSGGTIYAHPNPYYPQTLAPPPEISGNYATHYLFSPETGQTYADPMFYHGLGALERWDAIQASSRSVLRSGQRRRTTSGAATRAISKRRPAPAPEPAAPMASLQEIVDK